MEKFKNIAIYGGGSWGTALACQVARCYDNALIFLRDHETIAEIINNRTNSKYFGTIKLPSNIIPSSDVANLIDKEVIIIAVPSFAFQGCLNILKNAGLSENVALLVASKGFGKDPTSLLSDKAKLILPANPIAFIAGPNLAKEVVQNMLTTVTIASCDIDLAKRLAISLISKHFKPSITDYVVAVQVAGAVKNIMAIMSGWYDARGYGANAKAGLITAAIAEIKILAEAIDGDLGDNSVLHSPGILGDLILTCYSKESRNWQFGYELGMQKAEIIQFLKEYPSLVEGREAVPLILDFIRKYNLTMPIISSVAKELKLL
jgi:glycerol-3-phosphate dehydrogenase (NAD(P)+)